MSLFYIYVMFLIYAILFQKIGKATIFEILRLFIWKHDKFFLADLANLS